MPELPEVETVVRGLREPLVGRTILTAEFPKPAGRMTNIDSDTFAARLQGQRVRSLSRRAKYIVAALDRDTLLVHLRMTGRLYIRQPQESDPADAYLRVRFTLDDGHELRFSDARKFGRVLLTDAPDSILPALGPEPLEPEFTLEAFAARLAGRKGVLKTLLLNQAFIAGVGNIYADEALNMARLHPLRTADSLSSAEIKRLYHAIRQALETGITMQGASINWYRKPDGTKGEQQQHLRVYHDPRQEKDKRCPECGTPIQTMTVGQRGTHFCPKCQKVRRTAAKAKG